MEMISKLEAARQQLAVAIRLFFAEQSAVAVHTLTAAWRMRRSSATPHAGVALLPDVEGGLAHAELAAGDLTWIGPRSVPASIRSRRRPGSAQPLRRAS